MNAAVTSTPARAALPSAASTPERSLRILFVVQRGTLLRFALLVEDFARRGHEIHIAFTHGQGWRAFQERAPGELPGRALELAEALETRYSNITHGDAPQRRANDTWAHVAWMVRALADLAQNANPQYQATASRLRTRKRLLKALKTSKEFEPIGRAIALRVGRRLSRARDAAVSRRAMRIMSALEDAIPASRAINAYLRQLAPDVVIATGTFRHASDEVDVLKSARRLRIPAAILVASWDNLTNKGSLKFVPERVIVWNEAQVREAVELHQMPAERVRATGAHTFDEWFARRPSRTRDQLLAEVGLDPQHPYVVYLCSSGGTVDDSELPFIKRWLSAVRSADDDRLRRLNVLIRPYPRVKDEWEGVELGVDRAVVWPPRGVFPVLTEARTDFFDTLAHSAAVVGINTTAMIEAAILGKSVLTVLVPEFRQQSTIHFHHLLVENGGFLHVAKDLDEHVEQLGAVLGEDEVGAARRRRFVEAFVRPAGLDRPAAEVASAAIEELATLPVTKRRRLSTPALRIGLGVEARLIQARRMLRRLRPQSA